MLRVRVDLDVGGDRRFFSQAVAEDVLAGIGLREVAIRHDVDAGGADSEDRDLEAFRQWMDGDRRVGKRGSEESEQLALLDERLRHLGGLRPVRGVVLGVERELGAVHPARVVNLLNRQVHALLRARAEDTAAARTREKRSQLVLLY